MFISANKIIMLKIIDLLGSILNNKIVLIGINRRPEKFLKAIF